MDTPQGQNPPQISAVTSDTKLITVTVGGNDIIYNGTAVGCGNPDTVCTAPPDLDAKLATARTPDLQERAVLLDSLNEFRSTYRLDQQDSSKLLSVGEAKTSSKLDPRELAAWTTLASMILNLDETITKQ